MSIEWHELPLYHNN